MTTYRLLPLEGTQTIQYITRGKKTVGRVVRMGDGSGYLGIINRAEGGREEFTASTVLAAFEGVVAKRLGYGSASALKESNAKVRAVKRVQSARARDFAARFVSGNFKEQIAVIDEIFGLERDR
jgi:hypothetical protein